ncbi:arginine repressor [Streptococcus urinalis FB127-CNA-2]|uniref:Arginine repressor n=1 Tax=Streptococcus urinalis 2285-97 TaxID=764291 RepID=G5KGQ9_9STRE|nr:arginine repressor [Streptococcus urinalis]EHJ55672.1 arginine repressor [Streptococcus urinalis 2285-97]EKS20972.1 arginine repressor [Streptococcus urinalis FB127-CNA-2]VEF30981.1 transcriptional regulator of arginine metabolism [Streptococcus urinalis]
MNKILRQNRIKDIIQLGHVGTQEEIKQYLQEEGITVTQATLSRDLREIGLLKLRDKEGKLYYSLPQMENTKFSPFVRSFILKVSRAGFMLVLHTNLGEADVLANYIDADNIPEVLGTVAGADTLLVICQDEDTAKTFEQDLTVTY